LLRRVRHRKCSISGPSLILPIQLTAIWMALQILTITPFATETVNRWQDDDDGCPEIDNGDVNRLNPTAFL
jgi:hypothetical protein